MFVRDILYDVYTGRPMRYFLKDNELDLLASGSNALNLLIITFFLSLYVIRKTILDY